MKKINQTINWKEESFRYAKNASSSSTSYKIRFLKNILNFFLIKELKIYSMSVVEMEIF